jgi:hypothetical protein
VIRILNEDEEDQMDQALQTIDKWKEWLSVDLYIGIKNMLVSRMIFVAFVNNLLREEETAEQRIVFWIVWNYYEAACMTVRRFCDKDPQSRSLMALLRNMKNNLHCFPRFDWKSADPTFQKTPSEVMKDFSDLVDGNIEQLETFTRRVDDFATKHIAHLDKKRFSHMPVDIDELIFATEGIHAIYRFYAMIMLGMKPYGTKGWNETDFHDGSVAMYENACRNLFNSRYFRDSGNTGTDSDRASVD